MSIKRLENLLKPSADGGLGKIVRHAAEMGSLVEALQAAVGTEAAGSVLAANIRDDGELVVLVSSSVWVSRLRFETEDLMQAARDTGAAVSSCSVRVCRP